MAKVKVEAGKTISSVTALARDLLGGKKADAGDVKALAKKIKTLNSDVLTKKNQDLTSNMVLDIGKKTTKKFGTLIDRSDKNKFNFVSKKDATPQGGGISIGASSVGSSTPVVPAIKTAPIDTVQFVDEALSAELLLDLLFEDVGGQELLTIARNDTVNGQDVVYQPFKNLGILQEIYNPTNLLKLQETSDKIFSNFTINLRDKIPKVGSGLNGANYYLDLAAGDGIIEFINLKSDEQVEVQIVSAGIIEDVGI
jgi:hypothetical protein